MYRIKKKKQKNKEIKSFENVVGFPMGSRKKVFTIQGESVSHIVVYGKLARPLAVKKVSREYQKLLQVLMDLLTSDDDTGDALREALGRIEKFRQEIKNKYRDLLKKKELEEMGRELKVIQKEAKMRYVELEASFYEATLQQGKGK